MKTLRLLGKIMFLVGMAMMAIAVFRGEFEVALFMIFLPVLIAKTFVSTAAVILIFFGMMTWIFGMLEDVKTQEEVCQILEERSDNKGDDDSIKSKTTGLVLIGPVLVVWDSDYRMILLAVVITMVMLSSMLVLYFR